MGSVERGTYPRKLRMRKLSLRFLFVIFFVCTTLWLNGPLQGADKFPSPVGAVNDFAGVIPPDYKNSMERLAIETLQKTGVALVVATFPEIGGDSPEDFVNRLYQAWGIGKKGEDKGVLIFVAVKERKFRIETGYGVEGVLPDGLVGQIRDQYAIPYLRKGDYGQGLFKPMAAIAQIVSGEAGMGAPEPDQRVKGGDKRRTWSWREKLWLAVFLIIILPLLLFTRTGRYILLGLLLSGGRGGGGGGGFGGFGGGGFGGFGGGSSGGGGAGGNY